MPTKPMHVNQRYDMTKSAAAGWWSVIDLFTGQPAAVDGVTLDRLELGEADDLVDLLNAQERMRLGGEQPEQ